MKRVLTLSSSLYAALPMDELLTPANMYYHRAKKDIRDTATASLRDFYSAYTPAAKQT